MNVVKTEQELADSLKKNESEITIEGDLTNKVIRIHAVGQVAWVIAFGAIAVAVTAVMASPATIGAGAIVSLVSGTAAATILGGSGIAVSAVMIAVAAGGVSSLNSLRSYKIVSQNKNSVTLRK